MTRHSDDENTDLGSGHSAAWGSGSGVSGHDPSIALELIILGLLSQSFGRFLGFVLQRKLECALCEKLTFVGQQRKSRASCTPSQP